MAPPPRLGSAEPRGRHRNHVRRAVALLMAGLGAGLLGPACVPGGDHEGETKCGEEWVSIWTDPRHCGGCYHACADEGLGGEDTWCFQKVCYAALRLATTDPHVAPVGLALTGTDVYWATGCRDATPRGGEIGRAAKGATDDGVTLAEEQLGAHAVAADDGYLYWAIGCAPPACCSGGAEILRMPLAGGDIETVAPSSLPAATGLAIDATHVYFTTAGAGIWRVEKTGGEPEALVGEGVFGAIVLVGDGVYAAGYLPSQSPEWSFDLYRLPKSPGSPVRLTTGEEVQSLAADATHLYWGSCAPGGVHRLPLAGGGPEELALGGPSCDERGPRLALDEAYVYWSGGATLHRVPKAGAEKASIFIDGLEARGLTGPIAVDEAYVYLSNGPSILRARK